MRRVPPHAHMPSHTARTATQPAVCLLSSRDRSGCNPLPLLGPTAKRAKMSKMPSAESSSASSIFSSLCSSSRCLYCCSETMTPLNCFASCLRNLSRANAPVGHFQRRCSATPVHADSPVGARSQTTATDLTSLLLRWLPMTSPPQFQHVRSSQRPGQQS